MPTVEEVLIYLGIDYADDMINANITRCINTANVYLQSSIGATYPDDDPRVKELALLVISDLYNNREMTEKSAGNVRRLFDDMCLQLRLELSRSNG